MIIKYLRAAKSDLIDGYTFYESQKHGLGTYFLDTIFSDIDSLILHYDIYPTFYSYQRVLSKKFPYAIYYKTEIDTIFIYAVIDCRRNPLKTTQRLK